MDPQYERRLRDEVIYLHSLWHQGPPQPTAAPAPAPAPAPVLRHHLHPNKSTQFKKQRKKPNNKSTLEWPCPPSPPPSTTTGWPPHPNPKPPLPLSLDENPKDAQQNALKTVHKFFTRNNTDESDVIDSSSSDDEDEDDDDNELTREDDGREDYGFFVKLFGNDVALKDYYEKNYVKGRFICLVCGAMKGKKAGKKYTSCLGLVQHSITIAKTKKRRAHRAFGQAVCNVLGWDIDQLPTIVSLLSGRKSEDVQGSSDLVNNVDSVEGNVVEVVPESGANIGMGVSLNGDEGDMHSGTSVEANEKPGDVGIEHQSVEELAAEVLTIGAQNENNGVGNETQELQIDSVVFDGLKEDNVTEI
ncbi:hypothetical protein ACJIZ3_011177 [Penstemon smallii]|uniref:Uncharacterized protein n=1 Tax=Penstemon smallii TaxID=265156 RepID=A0ABD3ULY7_9LAMI